MRLEGENFLSWERLEFDLGKGVTLIQGFNYDDNTPEGSGKSAILNLMCWTLYGKIPKDANIDDVVMKGKKVCKGRVILPEFTVGRYRGPNDLFIQYADGRIYRGSTAIETQKEIIKLLDMSYETFLQVIYFAQNYPNKFVTANQEGKGKIITEIQNLEQFDRGRKIAADRIKTKTTEKLTAQKDVERFQALHDNEASNVRSFEQLIEQFQVDKVSKIKGLFGQIDSLEKEVEQFVADFEKEKTATIKDLKSDLKEAQSRQKEAATELKELVDALKEADLRKLEGERNLRLADCAEHQQFVNEMKVKLRTMDSEVLNHEKRVKDLKRAEQDLGATVQRVDTKKKQVKEAESEFDQAGKDVAAAIEAMENPDKEKCPTCGQDWDGDPKHYEREVEKAQSANTRAGKALKSAQNDLKEAKEQKTALEEVVGLLKKEVSEFKAPDPDKIKKALAEAEYAFKANDSRVKEIDAEVLMIQKLELKKTSLAEKVMNIAETIEKLKLEIEESEAMSPVENLKKFQVRQETLEKQIEQEDQKEPELLESKLKDAEYKLRRAETNLKTSTEKLEAVDAELVRLEALREGFREVKAYTFENVLKQLTSKTNKYLAQLFNQNVKIKFQNVDMKIETTVTIDGHERPLGLYSGGQFRRIALAVDLALADITLSRKNNKLNLIIMDEYFKDLSEVSMERVLNLLQARKTPTLLIEHNSIFKSIVDQTFELELRDGVSRRI